MTREGMNDVWFWKIMPMCGLKELLLLRGMNHRFCKEATDLILQKKLSEICAHCSPTFIIQFMPLIDITQHIVKYRKGRIEPELFDYIIHYISEKYIREIIYSQKLNTEQLRKILTRRQLMTISSIAIHEINYHQYLPPELLFEFQEVMAYSSIHNQKHLHSHLIKLQETCNECRLFTKWVLITRNNPLEIYVPVAVLLLTLFIVLKN